MLKPPEATISTPQEAPAQVTKRIGGREKGRPNQDIPPAHEVLPVSTLCNEFKAAFDKLLPVSNDELVDPNQACSYLDFLVFTAQKLDEKYPDAADPGTSARMLLEHSGYIGLKLFTAAIQQENYKVIWRIADSKPSTLGITKNMVVSGEVTEGAVGSYRAPSIAPALTLAIARFSAAIGFEEQVIDSESKPITIFPARMALESMSSQAPLLPLFHLPANGNPMETVWEQYVAARIQPTFHARYSWRQCEHNYIDYLVADNAGENRNGMARKIGDWIEALQSMHYLERIKNATS